MKHAVTHWFAFALLAAIPFLTLSCGENLIDLRSNGDASDGNSADANTSVADGNAAQPNTVASGNTTTPAANPNASNSNPPSTTSRCTPPKTPVTYNNTTKALINQHCESCHAKRSPVMDTFAKAQMAFVNGGAQDEVQSGRMPTNETLSDAIKCQFEAWADNNYAN